MNALMVEIKRISDHENHKQFMIHCSDSRIEHSNLMSMLNKSDYRFNHENLHCWQKIILTDFTEMFPDFFTQEQIIVLNNISEQDSIPVNKRFPDYKDKKVKIRIVETIEPTSWELANIKMKFQGSKVTSSAKIRLDKYNPYNTKYVMTENKEHIFVNKSLQLVDKDEMVQHVLFENTILVSPDEISGNINKIKESWQAITEVEF